MGRSWGGTEEDEGMKVAVTSVADDGGYQAQGSEVLFCGEDEVGEFGDGDTAYMRSKLNSISETTTVTHQTSVGHPFHPSPPKLSPHAIPE